MKPTLRLFAILLCCLFLTGFATSCGGGDDEDGEDRISSRDQRRTEEAEDEEATEEAGDEESDEDDGDDEPTRSPRATPTPESVPLPDSLSYSLSFDVDVTEPGVTSGDSEFDVEGAFVAPDSHEFTVSFVDEAGPATVEVVVIGDKAWTRAGGDEWSPSTRAGVADLLPFTTANVTVLENYEEVINLLAGRDGEDDQVNGVDAIRYDFDEDDTAVVDRIFGSGFFTEVFGSAPGDLVVWLDAETRQLMRATFEASGANGEIVDGVPADAQIEVVFELNIIDINDDSIDIEPPI